MHAEGCAAVVSGEIESQPPGGITGSLRGWRSGLKELRHRSCGTSQVEAESWSTLHAVQKDSAFLSSEGIAVRRFHAILLWPVRVTPFGELKKLQDNPDTGSSDYLRQCGTWLSGPGLSWNIIPDYYEDAGRRDAPTEDQRYAEYLYFHPYIQRCFYSSAARRAVVREADSAKSHLPMLILQRRDIIAARIRLRDDSPLGVSKLLGQISLFFQRM